MTRRIPAWTILLGVLLLGVAACDHRGEVIEPTKRVLRGPDLKPKGSGSGPSAAKEPAAPAEQPPNKPDRPPPAIPAKPAEKPPQ